MFKSARIKLTTWYLVIIMMLSITMSVGVYRQVLWLTERALAFNEQKIKIKIQAFSPEDRAFFEREEFQKPINDETVKEIREDALLFLALVNLSLLIFAGGLGYFLAGKTLTPIEEMLEKQKKFVADAAHEVKTPLTAIKTTLEVQLRNKNLTLEDAKKSMKDVLEEVDELSVLSLKLLEESKYTSGMVKLEKVLLNKKIEDVLKTFDAKIKSKKLVVNLELKNDFYATGDKKSIKELFSILIDNAIKFNMENGFIKIAGQNSGQNIILEFTNKANLIPEKDLARIFDRFYKSDQSRGEDEGFGLGLSIAKEIVTKHGGGITVRNNDDESVSFIVYLLRA